MKHYKRLDNVPEDFNLFPELNYTYDFIIYWEEKARHIFFDEIFPHDPKPLPYGIPHFYAQRNDQGEIITRMDTKPGSNVRQRGGKVSSAYTFVYKQRLLWQNQGIYIEKFIPVPAAGGGAKSSKFITTFVPQRYYFTDGGRQLRKINFETRSLDQFVQQQTEKINHLKQTE
jgi:hypothetical protein